MVKHTIFGVERDIDIPADCFASEEELAELEAPLGELEHGWFSSSIDGAQLHYRCFPPPTKPEAIMVFLHGVTAHSGEGYQLSDGRKTNLAILRESVNKHNMILYSHDHYGHGYSEGTRFFIPSWENNLQDSINFIKIVDEKHNGELPIFVGGISYGGTLSLLAGQRFHEDPSVGPKTFGGLLLMCPAVVGDLPPWPVKNFLQYVLAPLYPHWTPFFMPNPISAERIWSDPEALALHTKPRILEMNLIGAGRPFRLGTALSLVQSLEEVESKITGAKGLQVPFFLLHGTSDFGVKIEGSDLLWATTPVPEAQREYIRVPDGYHDLLSMKDSADYLEKMILWMKKRISEISS